MPLIHILRRIAGFPVIIVCIIFFVLFVLGGQIIIWIFTGKSNDAIVSRVDDFLMGRVVGFFWRDI